MGVAYYPSFEKEIDGYNPSVEVGGKPLARAIYELDDICAALGVPTIMSFYCESNSEAFRKVGEKLPKGMKDDPIEWTTPEVGLKTFEALITYLEKTPDAILDAKGVLEDLLAFCKVMKVAQKNHVRFRLRIDI